jgi:hypothetical protein
VRSGTLPDATNALALGRKMVAIGVLAYDLRRPDRWRAASSNQVNHRATEQALGRSCRDDRHQTYLSRDSSLCGTWLAVATTNHRIR